MTNVWFDMPGGSQRRATTKKEIYWIREHGTGKYGLRIDLSLDNDENVSEIKLKNIDFFKSYSPSNRLNSWVLLLNDYEEHDIFQKLCEDLIDSSEHTKDEPAMIKVIINRLDRWQKLFDRKLKRKLSFELQMGLFSELYFLKEYLSNTIGINKSIEAWGGPESDLQDFLMTNCVIEIKSHLTSKNEVISISSIHQLESPKEYFYLGVIALSKSSEGDTVDDLIKQIKALLLLQGSEEIVNVFEEKVLEYGFHELLHFEQLEIFKVDRVTFYKVNNYFPKLDSTSIPSQIIRIQYQIDLTRCLDYQMNFNDMKIEV